MILAEGYFLGIPIFICDNHTVVGRNNAYNYLFRGVSYLHEIAQKMKLVKDGFPFTRVTLIDQDAFFKEWGSEMMDVRI